MQINIEKENREREALGRILETIRTEAPNGNSRRLVQKYIAAIREMKDVADMTGQTTPSQEAALLAIDDFAERADGIISDMCIMLRVINNIADDALKEPEPTVTSIGTRTKAKAKKPDGLIEENGHLYIYKNGTKLTGWVKFKGYAYYLHKTGTKKYPVGSATMGEMRIRNGNKWYAMDGWGRLITEDYYIRKGRFKKRLSLKLRPDGTVKFVYNTSACFAYRRYSTALRRYQESQPDNSWKTVEGMQFYPDYVDHQR